MSTRKPPVSATLQRQDYREFLASLPRGSVDLLLTDPPYAISRETGFQSVKAGVKRFAVSMDFGRWDHSAIDLSALAAQAYRVLRRGGTAIVFYDLWKISTLAEALTSAGFRQLRLVIWEKTNPVPLNSSRNYLTNAREIAVLAVKGGTPTFHSQYDSGVYRLPIPREKRFHPTQKPLALMQQLIEKHSDPGDLVIDCFAGSGTTAVAAMRACRSFAGCEIDARYLERAQVRLQQAG